MIYTQLIRLRGYVWLLGLIGSAVLAGGCQSADKATAALNNPVVVAGQQLAARHCGSCHQAVLPDMLDKETWVRHVLPAMAPRLGIESYEGGYYYASPKAALSYDDWQRLVYYFETLAPATLERARPNVPVLTDWALFALEKPQRDTSKIAETTLVVLDTIGHQLYSGDGLRNDLTRWDAQLRPTVWKQLASAPVDAQFFRDAVGKEHGVFTSLGTMMAEDIAKGEVLGVTLSGPHTPKARPMATNLPRPLQAVPADLNKDGRTDWVVCGFGHLAGGLYWLRQEPNQQYTRLPIREVAGAIQATVGDYNGDGWPDIMALFAHADEGIWLLLNDKKGGFTERQLLGFPPVYGSTSFQLGDFNKDGLTDILYTCGDNSDYSQILKPFHGVYIYLNRGNYQYRRQFFYPVNGCVKAMAADFDLDGDLDIASIAFFADFEHNPGEGFLYFDQSKPMQFQPHAPPIASYGRWICMDVNDWDQDGDMDVIVGNFSKGFLNRPNNKPGWDTYLPLLVLRNTTR